MLLALVEDNAELRELTASFLRQCGFSVLAVESAEDLSEAGKVPDIYIVDVNLPGLSGFGLIKRLREISADAGIIVVSARDRQDDVARGYKLGADIYLTKPLAPEVLHAAVQRLARRFSADNKDPAGCCVDRASKRLTHGDAQAELSDSEVALLWALCTAGRDGLERWQMAELLGMNLDGNVCAALEGRVTRLRRKLRRVGLPSAAIRSRRNVGYVLTVPIRFNDP